MRTETLSVVNKHGIHARTASKFASLAKSYTCQVQIGLTEDDLQNGKSIMGVLTVSAQRGSTIVVRTNGSKEAEAMEAIKTLIANRFDEPE